VRLLGAADAQRQAVGYVRSPINQSDYNGTIEQARAQLGQDAFATCWAEGHKLTLDEVVEYATRARGERKRSSSGWTSLTPTEERVVELVMEGLTNPQIAARLFITRGTLKVHLEHIFKKLAVSTRTELATLAIRHTSDEPLR
jgi:DNA-binding CsgD family transcriptional regulator